MNWKLTIFFIIVLFFAIESIEPIFALVSYPSTDQRLKKLPTYCVVEPSGLSSSDKDKYVNIAKEGIAKWNSELQGMPSGNSAVWVINTKIITANQITTDCDIKIYFKETVDQLHQNQNINTIGIFSSATQSIDIAYGNLNLEKIYNIILHEIGHSFGLGHYTSDDDEINKEWYSGKVQSPSIMIPVTNNNPSLMSIMQVDLQKIRSIYGTNGFYAFSPSPVPPSPVPTPKPIIPSNPISPIKPFKFIQISEDHITVSKYDTKYVKITGQLEGITFRTYVPVNIIIKYPDTGFETHQIIVSKTGYFELPLVFDGNSKKGLYEVEASYLDHMDYGMNFDFYIGDKQITSNIPETILKSKPLSSDFSGKYLENISIQVKDNEYTVSANLSKFPSTSSVRVTADNVCPFNKQVFQKDFRDSTGTKVSFSFYQLSNGKPDTCSVHFSLTDFNGREVDSVDVPYSIDKPKKQPTIIEQPSIQKISTPIFTENQKQVLLQKIDSTSVSMLEVKEKMDKTRSNIDNTNKHTNSQSKNHIEKAWNLYNKLHEQRNNSVKSLEGVTIDYLNLENKINSVPTNHFDELSDRISKVNSEISQIDSDIAYVSQELSYADQAQNMENPIPKQCFLIWCW